MRTAFPALAFTLACLLPRGLVADNLPMQAELPFRVYSVAEGLNQKTVHGIAQDQDGFLWIATFGGINRFDGRTFESLTTRDGLRQNLIQALAVDKNNRIWVGDAAGGLTLIENGRVTRTFEPDEEARGVARSIIFVDDTLYIGTQPGGIRTLDLNNMDAGLSRIEAAPFVVYSMVISGDVIYTVGPDGVHRFPARGEPVFEHLGEDLTTVAATDSGRVAVGDANGRVGWLGDNGIDWLETRYSVSISGLSVIGEEIEWVFLDEQGMVRFGAPESASVPAASGTVAPLMDQEGVFWVPTRSGLARYLGSRFTQYSLKFEGFPPEVFAVEPGVDGDYWFGTNKGLLRVDKHGELVNVSDLLGFDRREVRDIQISSNEQTLWISQVQGATYGIDLATMSPVASIGDEDSVSVSAILDGNDRLWVGSFLGFLEVYDLPTGTSRRVTLGDGASVYALDMASDGYLWFAANFHGVYRIDTNNPDSEPELVIPEAELEQEYYTQIVVEGEGNDTVVWFSGIQGSVFRWKYGETERVIAKARLADNTVYAIQPLPDNTLVLATSRGVYRYDLGTRALEQYDALDGFVAIEAKVHATHYDGKNTLLIGTTSGVTAMDLTQPMTGVSTPQTTITRRRIDGESIDAEADATVQTSAREVIIDFTAVSTRKPTGIEYSYQLTGHDDQWSEPAATASISYSNLSPGPYTFAVRARLPGGNWSVPAEWRFEVPTPLWRTWWFLTIMLLAVLALAWMVVQLRIRSVAEANRKLREEVAERTRSIESGRRELEVINEQLSSEILERKKSDALRADVEARFQQAYHNSPIGMALVDRDGLVYDANPRMKALFWPDSNPDEREPLLSIVSEKDQEGLSDFLASFAADSATATSMETECIAHTGEKRRIDFHPSVVRNQKDELAYLVLLAHDVTETRAMTDQLEYQAHFDELTGLVNRRAFVERLNVVGADAALKNRAFLMFLDLDQFKVVNDTCGHGAGDELLCMVAEALRGCVRDNDTVARLGGDEFALIIVGCDETVAKERAEIVRQRIQDLEFVFENEIFRIGASIGVVPIDSGTRDLNELQQLADAACYAAKDAGRNRVHMVSGSEDAAHEHRGEMRWVQRLNHAIDTDNFELHGQRILPLGEHNRTTERIEILLRMRDRATRRLVPPGAFLPAAERYGLQGRLDLWVVKTVIDAIGEQLPREVENREFWVNLSGASVGDPNISHEIVTLVENSGLPRGCLNFEITETAVIRKISEAKQLIAALQSMGCRFALDDFGSGLSSFGYLKELNVDCLKIDGQFVRDISHDPTDRIFVKSIIDIAHTLGMTVIAEFVEDDRILGIIQSLGSDFAQGFGIHRPEPLPNMVSMTTAMRVAGLSGNRKDSAA